MPVIYVDTSDVDRLFEELSKVLSPSVMRPAMAAALNRTLTYVNAETKREVKKEYYITKSPAGQVKRATSGDLTAYTKYTGSPQPLHMFKHRAAANRYRSPVSVLVKKDNGWATHEGSNPAMFKGYGKIMLRDGGQRGLRTAHTLSVPQMVSNPDVFKVIGEKAAVKLYERLVHEVEWRLGML